MRKSGKKLRANNSGQLLIIAALAIAVLISATTIYVYELGEETNSTDTKSIGDFVLALKQGIRNAMISSLVNASEGGEKTVLAANLDKLSQVIRSSYQFGICQLDYTVFNDSKYDSGVWLSWNANDLGVSSAYANFTLKVNSMGTNLTIGYTLNVTTSVTISGYCTQLSGTEKMVNLTCRVYDDGENALARNMSLSYENLGSWIPIDSSNNLSILDYGNGTYAISFTVRTSSDRVQVSVGVYDARGIFVRANTTCYNS
jgi:hypothetical protein